jgi:uncharacterized RDD family membrane protein YckC
MTNGFVTSTGITLGYASRGTRLLGQMVDGVATTAPLLVTGIVRPSTWLGNVLFGVGILWAVYYHFFADARRGGQSFAKQWLGIRVVNATTGEPCTFGQSFVRNLLTVLGPLDWIFIFGAPHQRLGDKAAGTIVVVAD